MNLSYLSRVNLIVLFDIYLLLTFLAGLFIRYRKYRAILQLIRKVPSRWPNLFRYIREQRALYLNWSTLLPVLMAFAVLLVHSGLYRLVWHSALVSPRDLLNHWFALGMVVCSGLLMISLDGYLIFRADTTNLGAVEKDLDRAEYWFTSWVGKAVKLVTFGAVHPQRMVKKEIRKTIATALNSMDRALVLWFGQIACRLLFAFCLWFCWVRLLPKSG